MKTASTFVLAGLISTTVAAIATDPFDDTFSGQPADFYAQNGPDGGHDAGLRDVTTQAFSGSLIGNYGVSLTGFSQVGTLATETTTYSDVYGSSLSLGGEIVQATLYWTGRREGTRIASADSLSGFYDPDSFGYDTTIDFALNGSSFTEYTAERTYIADGFGSFDRGFTNAVDVTSAFTSIGAGDTIDYSIKGFAHLLSQKYGIGLALVYEDPNQANQVEVNVWEGFDYAYGGNVTEEDRYINTVVTEFEPNTQEGFEVEVYALAGGADKNRPNRPEIARTDAGSGDAPDFLFGNSTNDGDLIPNTNLLFSNAGDELDIFTDSIELSLDDTYAAIQFASQFQQSGVDLNNDGVVNGDDLPGSFSLSTVYTLAPVAASVNAVPEPSTVGLLSILGLASLVSARRFYAKRKTAQKQ